MDLSIIVVNFNTRRLIQQCVESIHKYLYNVLNFEIIVIDNNSSDDSQFWLTNFAKKNSYLKLIFLKKNDGFASANNHGIKITSGRNILFLNSDTYLIDSSIKGAVEWIDSQNDVFGCGCCLLNPDGSTGVSYGHFPEFKTVLFEILFKKYNQFRAVIPEPKSKESIFEIDFPCGAFFLVKSLILKEMNGFDESFFMYFEETDLSKRSRKMGYSIKYLGSTKIVHIGGGSSKDKNSEINASLIAAFYHSWSLYMKKHTGIIESFLLKQLLCCYFGILIIITLFQKRKNIANNFKSQFNALTSNWVY